MGNSGSAANSENEDEETSKESIEDSGKEIGDIAVLDLTVLFEPKQLRLVAGKIKEDTTVSPLQQHHNALIRWLEERHARGAETVTVMQFVDSFSNKGVSKEVATAIFQQFDTEGEGVVDLDYLHEMLDLSSRSVSGFSGVRSDLQAVNSILQDCSLAPGFVDAFTSGKTVQINHGKRLFKFLSRNRALHVSIPVPALRGFITSTEMRLKVLHAHLVALKEKADSKKQEPPLQADEILKPINRCFTSAEVSSNRNDASKLIDNDNGTYWQSDGPARSHWVRLTIPANVVIKQLSMYVVASDQSYMPHHVVVHGGKDESNLRELNDVRIPNHITGDFTLLENLKVPYQVIQIAIKRCHSDGCDTRIRQVKAVGYRVVKSKGVSIMDATAMWYLSVLASTAQASLPVAPHLRDSIIQHTKISLSHMSPLSLSATSTEKPGFLSRNVMEQMEQFLHTIICLDEGPTGEELIVLLEFAMARGSLGSILDALKLLLEKIKEDYPAVSLLRTLTETEEKAVRKHGQKLPIMILSCDGGARDSSTSPSNVLSDNWKTDTYFTATGKTKFNIAFGLKSNNLLMVTRVYMKLSKGVNAPKGGMVFIFDSENIKDEDEGTMFQPLEEYSSWTEEDYKKMKDKPKSKLSVYDPVAFFNVDKDWADVDVVIDRLKTGSCVVIKFLGARQENAERLGIIGINVIGYEQNEDMLIQNGYLDIYNQGLPADEDAILPGPAVFIRCLKFLQVMSKDAVNLKFQSAKDMMSTEKDATIDIYDVTMEQVWKVYNLICQSDMKEEERNLCSEMLLNLFHIALPYLKPSAQRLRESRKLMSKGKKVNVDKLEMEVVQFSASVFQSLCDIVDNQPKTRGVHKIARSIILDGAEVFFPDAEARRAHLLSLVEKVMEESKAVSLSYTFESLCRFFSNKDASGLLGLPEYLPQESFHPESVVHVMMTLVSVAYRECVAQAKEQSNVFAPSNIVLLLCAMQKSLLAWCHIQCNNDVTRHIATNILLQYVEMVSQKSIDALKTLQEAENKIKAVDNLEYTFVSIGMRQLILFLNLFSKIEIDSVLLLRHLQPLATLLNNISKLLPELFTNGNGLENAQKQDDTTLREWEMESEHEYENNMNFTKVFNCPGCTSFRVEFSPQCQTERKYDYLEFTDSTGRKRRFDQSVGTEKWPLIVDFDAGQRLHFLFHSDGSNTAWGYKFKVSAIGSPDVAVTWICDLQLLLARCFGIFCSISLDCKKAVGKKDSDTEEKEDERALLHSELWGSLFRGGYMVGKLERSLSGFHRTSPADSAVNSFLGEISSTSEHPEDKSEKSKNFLTKCKELYSGQKLGGGELMENAVNAVFAALIWHTQELREIVASFASENPPKDIPSTIIQAYNAAETIRRPLLENRQKLLIQLDDATNENVKEKIDPDTPIVSCREKALFLLKFAGLSKFASRKQSTHGIERRHSILNRQPKTIQRQESVEQRKISYSHLDESSEKYPSFPLILDFVTNVSLSHSKIHDLLQLRCKYARTIAKVYTFAAEYIDRMCEVDQPKVPALLFLQNMLASQDSFPQHYAEYLNGCGLEIEALVRNSFYNFIRKLAEIVGSTMHVEDISLSSPIHKRSQAYFLHFMDVEWKSYDYHFITELNLPFLLINSMKGPAAPSKEAEEENELRMYERHQKYFKEAKKMGINEWCNLHRQQAPFEKQRDINLFIARYSSDLDVVITCDGCQEKIKGSRFRCLECADMDLCSTCYRKESKPQGHIDSHDVIDLRFTCDNCQAFIIETRIHCNECSDFDLCLGCYTNERYPDTHNSNHSISKSHLIPGGLLQKHKATSERFFTSYIHHHSWLQFSALALSLSESLQNKKGIEVEYVKHAIDLLLECLYKLVDSLLQTAEANASLQQLQNPNANIDTIESFQKISKVKFEDVENVIIRVSDVSEDVPSITGIPAPTEPLESKTLIGTLSDPSSEPVIVKSVTNNDSATSNTSNETEYFSVTSQDLEEDQMLTRSNEMLPMPALEESDNENEDEDLSQRSDFENIGIDEVDDEPVSKKENVEKLNCDGSALKTEGSGESSGSAKTEDPAKDSESKVVEMTGGADIEAGDVKSITVENHSSIVVIDSPEKSGSGTRLDSGLGKDGENKDSSTSLKIDPSVPEPGLVLKDNATDSANEGQAGPLSDQNTSEPSKAKDDIPAKDSVTETPQGNALDATKDSTLSTDSEAETQIIDQTDSKDTEPNKSGESSTDGGQTSIDSTKETKVEDKIEPEASSSEPKEPGSEPSTTDGLIKESLDWSAMEKAAEEALDNFYSGEDKSKETNTEGEDKDKENDNENKDSVDKDRTKGDEKTSDLKDDLLDDEANNRAWMQEKLLGLIAAIIPSSNASQQTFEHKSFSEFISRKLLPAIFTILKDPTSSVKLRLVTLGVLTKTLHCFGPEVADAGVLYSSKLEDGSTMADDQEKKEESQPGSITAVYLFNLGAECFKNSDLETASGVDNVLRSLWRNTKWSESLSLQANKTLEELSTNSQDPSLLSLFSLMFLAGFPDTYRQGSLAHAKKGGDEIQKVVVLNYSPEQTSVNAVNFKNRKKVTFKEHTMEPIVFFHNCINGDRLPLLLDVMQKMFQSNKGQSMSVERMWVLGLISKALLNILKNGLDSENMLKIVRSGIIPYIVNLSCQGTGFSNQWLLRDLEVLSWKLYKTSRSEVTTISPQSQSVTPSKTPLTPSTPPSKTDLNTSTASKDGQLTPGAEGSDQEGVSAETPTTTATETEEGATDDTATGESTEEGAAASTAAAVDDDKKKPIEDLDTETQLCMERIHEALGASYPILRALYEHYGQNREVMLEEVQRRFDGVTIRVSDELRDLAKTWEADGVVAEKKEEGEEEFVMPVDSSTDVGILKFQPQTVEFKDLRAKPEGGENPNKLISSITEAEINETMLRQKRSKSGELLKKELEISNRENPRDFAKKLNHAVAVGYARHLVGWLFASWPSTENILPNLLDNIVPHNIVGLLDLIQSVESKQHFQKVVHNFIRCCNKQLVQPLALSAVQCMGEVRLASETRESDHKYKNNSKVEDKVHIPGATSLFIKFDERCSTEHNCDELLISSSSNYTQNRRTFSGSTDWHDFEMPGDTVYYRFTSDSSNYDWGWKFTVTGGQLGRFETGCTILSALLAQDLQFARRLPLKQLWSWLIVVTCNQVGQQRLMATGLLLRILQIAAGDSYLFGENSEPTPEKNRPNLSLLRPLWSLYTTSIESDTGTSLALISPVIRGLSELFLVVENVAQDWGVADDLVAGLATDQKLKNCFTKIVKNIAAIGLAIGIPNKAFDMIQKAKEKPPSPLPNEIDQTKSSQNKPGELRITTGDSDALENEDEDEDVVDDHWMDAGMNEAWGDSDDNSDTDTDEDEDDDDDDEEDDSDVN
eukprot:TCONS_00020380-protein